MPNSSRDREWELVEVAQQAWGSEQGRQLIQSHAQIVKQLQALDQLFVGVP